MHHEINKGNDSFRIYRYQFLKHMLNMAMNENDEVDKQMKLLSKSIKRICSNIKCATVYETLKRKCDKCNSPVFKDESDSVIVIRDETFSDQLETLDVGQNKTLEVSPKVVMAESFLLNPNSYKNIEAILGDIKDFAIVDEDHEWRLGCDGPPYCLSERIAENSPDEFDFASFVPGLGHLHMNQMQTIFRILDRVILEPLGKEVLNFQSPKAYDFFINAKDTHKSWQTVKVLLFGTTLELCKLYLQEAESINSAYVVGFLEWVADHRNSNLVLTSQLILNYTLAIYLLKIGVRCNDVEMINAAIYREVEYRDLKKPSIIS